ncbi:MAG: hypothetical protein AAF549_05210 [Pseudomonadota bacterium]
MTAIIKHYINDLHQAIHELEEKVEEKKKEKAAKPETAKKKTADLFSFTPAQDKQEAAGPDTKALASRLDGAIAKVEKLLQEG